MYVKYDFKSCVPCKEGYTPLVDESHLFGVAVDGGGGEYFFNYSCSCPCDKVSAFCNNFCIVRALCRKETQNSII